MCQASREKGESLIRWGQTLWGRARWRMWGQSPHQSSTESLGNTRRSFQARKDQTTGTRITAQQQVQTNSLGANSILPSQGKHQQHPAHPTSEFSRSGPRESIFSLSLKNSASHDSIPNPHTISKRFLKRGSK